MGPPVVHLRGKFSSLFPRFPQEAGVRLNTVNRTLTELRAELGVPARFAIDAEARRRKTPVITSVRWTCGCRAEGPGLRSLVLQRCVQHRVADARPAGRGVALLRSLLSGSDGG
jgi:hypothetical protein